ncbi:MAG TPA: cell division protein FtsZ [Verrucomicrobiae bacterium]|nr:cell division protein FtsZ [Verrucomicrobiae bacterium]
MSPEASIRKFKIKVIGVGGAGCNAARHFARLDLPDVPCALLNTDAAALAQIPSESKILLGFKSMRGLGAGGDPERGRQAAEEDREQIRALCEGTDLVFLMAGLGGGTGTGAGPVVARIAKEAGALVLGMVVLPFDCEGSRRQRQAQTGLHEFKNAADGVICLPNQKLLQFVDEKTSLPEAFAIGNDWIAQGVRGIWRMLSQPGLINVDFADLSGVLRDRHAEGSLATAEAQGPNRATEVINKLLAHPLIENGHGLAETGGALVSIAAANLTMSEVTRIMEQITRHCEQAHVIMGASIDENFGDRLSVTLVASRRENAAAEEPAANPRVELRQTSRHANPPPIQLPNGRGRKSASRLRQTQLQLEIVSKGRFEKSEPTLHQGQDLDVPTYIRRGIALN